MRKLYLFGLILAVIIAAAGLSCDSGGSGDGGGGTAAGETCETENEFVCGAATGGAGVPAHTSNTEYDHPDTPPRVMEVPTVFNGDFESGTIHTEHRFPPRKDIPG